MGRPHLGGIVSGPFRSSAAQGENERRRTRQGWQVPRLSVGEMYGEGVVHDLFIVDDELLLLAVGGGCRLESADCRGEERQRGDDETSDKMHVVAMDRQ